MDYNVTFRKKNGGIQAVISYKQNTKWKQVSKQGFETQKSAKPWIEKTVKRLEETIDYIDPDTYGTKFKEIYESYVKHITLYKEADTLKNYSSAKPYFLKIFDIEIDKITALQVQECVDDMVKKLNPSTIETYTSKIKKVFKYAIEKKIIKDNPALNVTLPKNKTNKRDCIKALNKAESIDLLSKISYKKHYLISLLAVTCGLRIGEILGLTWDRIDDKNSTLTVNRQWKIIQFSPLKYNFGSVKSKNSNRIVPIPPNTMAELKKYKKDYPIDISGRLFPYARTDSCSSVLNSLYKKIGYNISVHDLRHTYASTLIANGLDFKTVAELMGHDVKETIDTYSHFTSDMLVRAINVINVAF